MPTGPNSTSTTRRISKTFDDALDVAVSATTGIAAVFPSGGGLDVGGGRFRGMMVVDVNALPADSALLEVVVDNTAAMSSVKVLDTFLTTEIGTFNLSIDFSRDESMIAGEVFVGLRVTPVGDTITFNARIVKSDNDRTS